VAAKSAYLVVFLGVLVSECHYFIMEDTCMNDDYQTALEELDREFPGPAYNPSPEEYIEDQRRLRQRLKKLKKELKIFLLGITISSIVSVLSFITSVFCLFYILWRIFWRIFT
jgi:predicted PurR-regulated permease PerM